MARTSKVGGRDETQNEKFVKKYKERTAPRLKRALILPPPSAFETESIYVERGKDGPPEVYDPLRFPFIGYQLCRHYGLTAEQLSVVFGVCKKTVESWIFKHENFAKHVRKGRDEFDSEKIEGALVKRAMGYNYKEVSKKKIRLEGKTANGVKVYVPAVETIETTKHVPAEVKAIMFWLQNRQSDRWRNTSYIKAELESNTSHTEIVADVTQMSSEDIKALRDIIVAQQSNKAVLEASTVNPMQEIELFMQKAEGLYVEEAEILDSNVGIRGKKLIGEHPVENYWENKQKENEDEQA